MQFLAIMTLAGGRTPAELDAYYLPEARRVWALIKSSVFRRAWLRVDRPGAVALLEVADRAEARATVMSLPTIRDGVLEFELIELTPLLLLESLFGPQARDV